MLYLGYFKWPRNAPTVHWEYEAYTTEMAFDGAWTREGLTCPPMKFLLCMLRYPLDGLPAKEVDPAVQLRWFLERLLGGHVAGKQHVFSAGERKVVVKVAPLSAPYRGVGTPDVVYSIAVLRGPGVAELTPFHKSFYMYYIDPDLTKNVCGLDGVSEEHRQILEGSFAQNPYLSLAEMKRLFYTTQLPVYFLVAWFEDFYTKLDL